MIPNPLELPLYFAGPLWLAYIAAWFFIGSLWLGTFNNFLVRKDVWGFVRKAGAFWFMTLWPITLAFVLFVEVVFFGYRFGKVFIRPLGPICERYCDWVIAAYRGYTP